MFSRRHLSFRYRNGKARSTSLVQNSALKQTKMQGSKNSRTRNPTDPYEQDRHDLKISSREVVILAKNLIPRERNHHKLAVLGKSTQTRNIQLVLQKGKTPAPPKSTRGVPRNGDGELTGVGGGRTGGAGLGGMASTFQSIIVLWLSKSSTGAPESQRRYLPLAGRKR